MSREALEAFYARHHREGGRLGFTFGGPDRVALIAQWVGSGSRVLDVGCRDGTLTAAYASANKVVGLDVDRAALEQARQQLAIDTVWHDLSEPLPFADGSFEVVVAAEIFEHVLLLEPLLAEFARVLPEGGRVVGSVPNAFRLKNRLLFLAGRPYERDPTHLRQFSPQGLKDLLIGAGFTDVITRFTSSRFLRLSPRLFGNDIVFRARR